ncbi:MAG: nucleoside triphosphate pyrophosphohydrolase [Anaerolineaceae bacterium]|nr:nucleoside triphosphate pyrophosphohydrolase [Anaerolineaceae bacterium]
MDKKLGSQLAEIFDALQLDLSTPVTLLEAAACEGKHVPPFSPSSPALIMRISSTDQLVQIQSLLAGRYAGGHKLRMVSCPGQQDQQVQSLTLDVLGEFELPGEAALYSPAISADASLDVFQEVIAHLRAPDGCPWDRKQTHQSLRSGLLSEVYEVLEALDANDVPALQEELGDLLLQIVMHAQIAQEANEFSMVEVIQRISRKIVHRHPHVFGEVQVAGVDNVLALWEEIKAGERKENGEAQKKGMLDGVPVAYPALAQSYEYQDRVSRVGFDWDDIEGVWEKVFEEVKELQQAQDPKAKFDEFGDILFALVNLARWLKIDAESALRETNQRFRRRFRFVEQSAMQEGRSLNEMTLAEMDVYWDEAKRLEEK